MNKNIGTTDRIIRIIVGIISVYPAVTISSWFYVITIVAIGTALISWCGLYTLLGINTCKIKK